MPTVNTYALQRLISNLSPDELIQWEDDEGYAIPPPNMRDANDGIDTVQNAPRSATAYDRYNDAVRRNAEHEKMAPRVSEFKPNKWQRLAAAGANFAAGYVNAGGRTRVDPAAMQSINSSLLRPGYDKAKQQWEDQGRSLQIDERVAGVEAKTESENARRMTDLKRAEAYKKAQESSASYNAAREKKLDEDPWKVSPNGKVLYNSKGETKQLPADPGNPPAPTESQKMQERINGPKPPGFDKLTQEQQTTWMATGKIPAPPRPRAAGRGREEKPRIGTPGQFLSVETRKRAALAKAEAIYKKVATDTLATDADKAIALATLEEEKQRIMSEYDSGVEALGGTVLPREPKAPEAPGPVAKKYTEAEVRERAIAAGRDPMAAVQAARQKGLIQ